jgi:WD40 repeat protein
MRFAMPHGPISRLTALALALAFAAGVAPAAEAPADLALSAIDPRDARVPHEPPPPLLNLTGHPAEVYTVAFSPDGRRLASASNREVIVWDLAAGTELFTCRVTGTNVFGLAFSPGSKRLAVGISKVVKVLDAATGREESAVAGAAHFLFRMAYSPDGKRLAASSGSQNNAGELCVWDAATGQVVLRLGPQAGAVLNEAYSADGRRLAAATGATTGTRPGEVTVWEAASGREVLTLRGHADNVYAVAIGPDGRRVASASGVRGAARPAEVKLWEMLTGQDAPSLAGHAGPVFAVAYSPDGRLLATASGDRAVRLWEAATGREILCLTGHNGVIYSAAFSPDGKRLASAGADRAVKVWEVPGPGQQRLMEDQSVLGFLRRQAAGARGVLSVCTGALTCGAAGLLQGVCATTHWAAFQLLRYFGAIPVDERVVVDGHTVSAAGVTSGIDGALWMAAMLRGDAVARRIQLTIQYAPAPPFDSGSPATAPAEVLAAERAVYRAITEECLRTARQVAARLGVTIAE